MTTGEVKTKEAETSVNPLEVKSKIQPEFAGENAEIAVSVSEKSASNLKMKERFSRLKKSLRRRSVSIL
ncbi:MAG: hypothetical protein ACR2MG_05290 [Pyrinomonadaceae bacterium]